MSSQLKLITILRRAPSQPLSVQEIQEYPIKVNNQYAQLAGTAVVFSNGQVCVDMFNCHNGRGGVALAYGLEELNEWITNWNKEDGRLFIGMIASVNLITADQ